VTSEVNYYFSEHLNYAQHLDHVIITSLGTNQGQFTLGHVMRVIKPHSHTKDVIGQLTIDSSGAGHVPYLTSIHRLHLDDLAVDQITVDIPPEDVKLHNLQAGDLIMVRAQRFFPEKTDNTSNCHVTGKVMHVLQRAAERMSTGVKSSAIPSPSASVLSTNDSEVNDHVLQGLENELDNSIYHVTDVHARGAEASHVIADEPVFVLDLGEYNVRAGLHTLVNDGQTVPSLELSAMIACPKVPPTMLTAPLDEFYFGYEALRRRSVMTVSSLMDHGHVIDWNHVDQFIGHSYEQLQLISAEYPVGVHLLLL